MIRASAPGRAGIVGNPTDGYGGTVISCSLDERATVEILHGDRHLVSICGQQESMHDVDDLRLTGGYTDVAKAVLTLFPLALTEHRFHLRAETAIPMRAGLAGSTAMLVAILAAVLRLLRLNLNRYEIAETARRIEFDVMGVTCGFQDHYMAAFGGLNFMEFRDKLPGSADDPLLATIEPLRELVPELPLVLANTGVQRDSGSVHKGLRERWLEGEPAVVDGYVRIARLAREAKKALLSCDWLCLGAAMNENHAIQRDLGGSGEANEALIAAALRAGAYGAKLAGAGKGGTIIALHPDRVALSRALEAAGATRILQVTPGDGLIVEADY